MNFLFFFFLSYGKRALSHLLIIETGTKKREYEVVREVWMKSSTIKIIEGRKNRALNGIFASRFLYAQAF